MELIKDYDMKLHYHPGKANVVADALSRKSYANILESKGLPKELAEDIMELRLEIVPRGLLQRLRFSQHYWERFEKLKKMTKKLPK